MKRGLIQGAMAGTICLILGLVIHYFIPSFTMIFVWGTTAGTTLVNFGAGLLSKE